MGYSNFVLSVSEWIEKTDAIGIIVKKGKYGGTYAHKDIAELKLLQTFDVLYPLSIILGIKDGYN